MSEKKLKAFTLIEILVALTIIGVLLTFVAPYVLNRPDQARELKLKNDFMAISTALNLYKLDNGALPEPAQGLDILSGDGSKNTFNQFHWIHGVLLISLKKQQIHQELS